MAAEGSLQIGTRTLYCRLFQNFETGSNVIPNLRWIYSKSLARSAARPMLSQVNSGSLRPKCPPAAVF